ncbi:uncharacterized protein (DUF302 family) [Chitinophaga sp. W3I9]|uniref:DUF302 domain-containing protein n=1 Tax=Chitinophaga sp. W3I9 TaxID=3373924 RepID=UPI003D1BFF4E
MKTNNITVTVHKPFNGLLLSAREAITSSGFLLLHEINPQAILASHGITTAPIRQLLFFHPVYMQSLLQNAPEAVIEAPLKLVLRETGENTTAVSYFDPALHLQGYRGLAPLRTRLQTAMEKVLAHLF